MRGRNVFISVQVVTNTPSTSSPALRDVGCTVIRAPGHITALFFAVGGMILLSLSALIPSCLGLGGHWRSTGFGTGS